MTQPVDDNLTETEMRELLAELLRGWCADRVAGHGFESEEPTAKVATVYALTAHAHQLGDAVAKLIGAGFAVEAIPAIRSAYESAVTASWLRQVPDALPAFLNRNHNQQQALSATLTKAGWGAVVDDETNLADSPETYPVSMESKNAAKTMEAMCEDFVMGDQLYAFYRGLSWLTHPTAAVTELYLEVKPGSKIPTLHTAARYGEDFLAAWLRLMCFSLVWSARALNLIDIQRAQSGDRQRLRLAAQRLNIVEFLAVKPAAIARGKSSNAMKPDRNDKPFRAPPALGPLAAS